MLLNYARGNTLAKTKKEKSSKETDEYDLLNYTSFVTFFHQLIVGPIVYHKKMMPQFANNRNMIKNYRNSLFSAFCFFIVILSLDKVSEFLYFNFRKYYE